MAGDFDVRFPHEFVALSSYLRLRSGACPKWTPRPPPLESLSLSCQARSLFTVILPFVV